MANHCAHAHLLTVLLHSSHAILLSPELFQNNARLATYVVQWADYAVQCYVTDYSCEWHLGHFSFDLLNIYNSYSEMQL